MARRLVSILPLLAIASLSCSDPASVPPQGAIYVAVHPPAGGNECNVGSNYSLPSGTTALTAIRDHAGEDPSTGEKYRVVDGDDGVDVACAVKVNDPGSIDLDLKFNKRRSVAFSVRGNITANGGTAYIAEWDNQTITNLSGDCTITVNQIIEGAVFASYTCPQFNDEGPIKCAAEGAFVFENCDK